MLKDIPNVAEMVAGDGGGNGGGGGRLSRDQAAADSGAGSTAAAVAGAAVKAVGAAFPALQPIAALAAKVLQMVKAHKQVDPARQHLVFVVESVQRCLERRKSAARFVDQKGASEDQGGLVLLLQEALEGALKVLERIGEQQHRHGIVATVAKGTRAEGNVKLIKELEAEVCRLAGFVTFAMAAEAPTRQQLILCVKQARDQTVEKVVEALRPFEKQLGALGAGQGRIEEGMQHVASQVNVLAGKKMARETKEQALEQNRIIPEDVDRTEHKLGSGAHGAVTKVLYAGDEAAMKTIDLHGKCVKDRDKLLAEFMGELRLMCALRHPRVIQVYGAFEEGDELNLVMEYAQNGDVRQMLDRYDAEDVAFDEEYWELATRLAEQAVAGVRYVLGQGILHRDLKCLNLLLDRDHKVKVSDFGLAKATEAARFGASSRTEGAGPKGSMPWMAPEHLLRTPKSPPYNEACDVYSFAMVMFELVTRKQPWQELAGPQISAQVISRARPALPDVVPPDLRRLIERCWEHEAARRPPFKEVAELLATSRFGSRGGATAAAGCAVTGATVDVVPDPLLNAGLHRLVGDAWQERRCELSADGVLRVFEQERRDALIDFAQAWVWVIEEPAAADLAKAAQFEEAVKLEPVASRKLAAGSRRLALSARGGADHSFLLRNAVGGDIALAAPTAEDKAKWVAELRRQATRFVERLVRHGTGCCPWYHVPFSDGGEASLVVCEASSQLLRMLNAKDKLGGTPLNFVTIFGKARQGKSTLMNLLAGVEGLFEVSHKDQTCTRGVDLSAKVVAPDALWEGAAGGVHVGFVDVEGQGVEGAEYDTLLVTPALLLSKVLLFNWRGAPEADTMLELLGVLADAAESINLPGDDICSDDEGAEDVREENIFGHLHLVFRDWTFESDTAARELLDLEKPKSRSAKTRNTIRKTLKRVFTTITTWTLPVPVDNLQSTRVAQGSLTRGFIERVEELRETVGRQLAEGPTSLGGRTLTCDDLAELMPAVATAMNSEEGVLTPRGLFEQVTARKAERARARYVAALHSLEDELAALPEPVEEGVLRADFDKREAAARAVAVLLVVTVAELDPLRDEAWRRVRGANNERLFEQKEELWAREKQELEERARAASAEKREALANLEAQKAALEADQARVKHLEEQLQRKLAEIGIERTKQRSANDDDTNAKLLSAEADALREQLDKAKAQAAEADKARAAAEAEVEREKKQAQHARDELERVQREAEEAAAAFAKKEQAAHAAEEARVAADNELRQLQERTKEVAEQEAEKARAREAELEAARAAREAAEAIATEAQERSEAEVREARAAVEHAEASRAAEKKAAADARRAAEAQKAELVDAKGALEAKLAEQAAEAGGMAQRKDAQLAKLLARVEAAERGAADLAKAEKDAAQREAAARREEEARLQEAEQARRRAAVQAEERRAAAAADAKAEKAAAARAAKEETRAREARAQVAEREEEARQRAEQAKAEETRRKEEAVAQKAAAARAAKAEKDAAARAAKEETRAREVRAQVAEREEEAQQRADQAKVEKAGRKEVAMALEVGRARRAKAAGFDARRLKREGFDAAHLKRAGFDAKQLKPQYSADQLKLAGFNAVELMAAGFGVGGAEGRWLRRRPAEEGGLRCMRVGKRVGRLEI
eukprot:g3764.t1